MGWLRLEALLRLANAPGTKAEGAAALQAAERLAAKMGLAIVILDGKAEAFEIDRADLLEALNRIAHGAHADAIEP